MSNSRPTWTTFEKEYILKHYKDQTPEQMADALCKSPVSITQYMSRNRLAHTKIERNIVIELLRIKIVDPAYFRPTRKFYQATGFTQRRWWDLYYGRDKITTDEYLALCKHLKVELVDAFDSRQISLFPIQQELDHD